jgi:hypothetical protein
VLRRIAPALGAACCASSGPGTTRSPLRGIKGENPTTEAATKARISRADCAALARLAERPARTRLSRHSPPRPPLSRCRRTGRGSSIDVFLDTGLPPTSAATLLAVRGDRWLTVTISIAGHYNRRLRDEAVVLARAGFRLSA